MRLYIDEQLGNFVRPLSDAGHDILFAGDGARSGRTDAWHFRQAIDDGRVLLTFDRRDFEDLHWLWTTLRILGVVDSQHAGILTCAPTQGFTSRDWLGVVRERLNSAIPAGRLLRWVPGTGDWREHQSRPEED